LAQVSRTLGHLGSRIEPLCAAWPFIMSTPQVRDTLKYTRICKYWGSNRCKLGKDCNFAHSDLELRDQPDLVATRLCFQFSSKGRCKNGDACKFAHGKQELRTLPKAQAEKRVDEEQDGLEPMKIQLENLGDMSPMGALTPRSAMTAPLSPRSPLSPCSPWGNIGPWGTYTGSTPARGVRQRRARELMEIHTDVPTLAVPAIPGMLEVPGGSSIPAMPPAMPAAMTPAMPPAMPLGAIPAMPAYPEPPMQAMQAQPTAPSAGGDLGAGYYGPPPGLSLPTPEEQKKNDIKMQELQEIREILEREAMEMQVREAKKLLEAQADQSESTPEPLSPSSKSDLIWL